MCTITTLLLCLIVPRLVYAGWPMVKYKNGTVGILNDDGDVHVQNTNLFVYGKKVVHPEKCAPPGGKSQYFNGTEWMCLCEDGWSGLTCETPPALGCALYSQESRDCGAVARIENMTKYGTDADVCCNTCTAETSCVAWGHIGGNSCWFYSSGIFDSCQSTSGHPFYIKGNFSATSTTPPSESTGPPKCVSPGGDKLRYNGTNWICVCASGWTGDTCEIEPPLPQVSLESVISELQTKVENSKPLKCVPPGGDKLQYNGTNWICVCASGWTGDTCEIEPIVYLCGFGWGGVGWQGLTGVEAATFCQEHGAEHLDIRPNDANAALIVDTFKYTPEFAALAQESGSDPGSDSDQVSISSSGKVGDRLWTSVAQADHNPPICYNTNFWNPREYGDAGVGTRNCNSMGTFPICVSFLQLTFGKPEFARCVAAPAQLPLR
jgi:hypothetical protein